MGTFSSFFVDFHFPLKVWIDDVPIEAPEEESTIFQFCSKVNINLPCFCYHEKLTIAGNCRICLVESNNALAVSCAMPVVDNMRVFTNSKRVRKARESVMEFLLVNHPLDCPICDQGGECDLQDISLTFGSDRGRFYEFNKRSVVNLNVCGPLIKTVMTRCIHCTRCVRFISEISGSFDFGLLGRGNSMEIGTYIERFLFDELSANIIDICPVGALTSMPYAFTARPWELSNFESIDIMDSLASSVSLGIAHNKILRIIPLLNESINEEWITNKARFTLDSLSNQRLNYPNIRLRDRLFIISWPTSFDFLLNFLSGKSLTSVQSILGHFIDLNTAISFKDFFANTGSSNMQYETGSNATLTDFRFSYLLNQTLVSLEASSIILLIGTNPRNEVPLLNSRIRKNYLLTNKQLDIFSVGLALDYLTFPVKNLGNSSFSLKSILSGKNTFFKYLLFKDYSSLTILNYKFMYNSCPNIFVGNSILRRSDNVSLLNSFVKLLSNLFERSLQNNYLSIVSPYLGRISVSEVGHFPGINCTSLTIKGKAFSYLCGVDNPALEFTDDSFLIYQGVFKTNTYTFDRANLILPTTSAFERDAGFLNIEGRLRFMQQAITHFKFIFSDWEILNGMSIYKKYSMKRNFSPLLIFLAVFFF